MFEAELSETDSWKMYYSSYQGSWKCPQPPPQMILQGVWYHLSYVYSEAQVTSTNTKHRRAQKISIKWLFWKNCWIWVVALNSNRQWRIMSWLLKLTGRAMSWSVEGKLAERSTSHGSHRPSPAGGSSTKWKTVPGWPGRWWARWPALILGRKRGRKLKYLLLILKSFMKVEHRFSPVGKLTLGKFWLRLVEISLSEDSFKLNSFISY